MTPDPAGLMVKARRPEANRDVGDPEAVDKALKPDRLLAMAVAWLARRDLSRQQLRERLLGRATAAGTDPGPDARTRPDHQDPSAQQRVESVLDRLAQLGYLDDARFARERAVARSARLGVRRIGYELQQLQAPLDEQTLGELRASEPSRAQALWQRRFGARAADGREHARQMRFLLARGFDADLARRIVGPIPFDQDRGDSS